MDSNPVGKVFSIALMLFYLSIILCNSRSAANDININLNATTTTFSARYDIEIGTTNILVKTTSQDDGFFLIQVHSFAHKITLSNSTNFNIHNIVEGTNVGLVKILLPTDATKTIPFYLQANDDGTVLIAVTVYTSADPIPGGCSMTFNTDIAPYINLTYTNALIEADYQAASIFHHLCEENPVRLEMYRVLVKPNDLTPDAYFSNIEKMITVDNIRSHGENITDVGGQVSDLRKYISGYMGVGQLIAIVSVVGDKSAAYVPIVTYSCNVTLGYESCYDYNVTWWSIVATVMLVFGILMFCVEDFGDRITNYFLSIGIATYVIYNIMVYTYVTDWVLITILIGFIIGYTILFGCISGICNNGEEDDNRERKLPKFIISLLCGCVLGAFVVSGDQLDLTDSSVYWCVFILMSAVMFLLIFGLSFVNPFAYNLMGVMLIILSISFFANGTTHHIVTEVIRYMTVKHYDIAVKIDLYSIYIVVGGVVIALLRSIYVKAEGRGAIVLKVVRRNRRNEYMQI